MIYMNFIHIKHLGSYHRENPHFVRKFYTVNKGSYSGSTF